MAKIEDNSEQQIPCGDDKPIVEAAKPTLTRAQYEEVKRMYALADEGYARFEENCEDLLALIEELPGVGLSEYELGEIYSAVSDKDSVDEFLEELDIAVEPEVAAGSRPQRGRCQYCGCTDGNSCAELCWWMDAEETACSAPLCVEQYFADIWANMPRTFEAWQADIDSGRAGRAAQTTTHDIAAQAQVRTGGAA